MNQTFKRAMSLFMAMAMVLSMVPSFGTHVHAEELETEPVVVTEAPATEAPVVEAPVTEAPATEAPTQAPETEAPATEAPTEPATEAPEVVETEAPEVTTEATEAPVVETEPAIETEPVEETTPDETEETIPEEIFEEEIIEEEAVAITEITADLSGLSVNGLGADWENAGTSTTHYQGTINATRNSITITATSKGMTTTTIGLILTNNLGSEATLKFSYEMDSGTVTGASDGSFEKVLADEDQVEITFKSKRNGTSTLYITDISLISTTAADPKLTFMAPTNGSYTVDGVAVTKETVKEVDAGTELALVATAASGYQFFCWQKADGTYLSQDASYIMTAGTDETITPVFIDASVALFGVGTVKFDNLTEAGAAAAAGTNKTIVLLNNGTVSGSHTIPAGTTLLIPYDDANTAYGENASCTSWTSLTDNSGHVAWVSPTPYRTLTLAANANITVNGNIEVSGRHAAAGGALGMYGGSPTGKLGYINMLSGSHIDLNSGANLYAWGYVYGDGTITAKSGASIYENFQVMDFRGGSMTSALAMDFVVFPLSQYYVQNVEVATRYEYGSSEYIATSFFLSNQCHSATVKFIGTGAMFQPADGSYFIKDYNPTKDTLEMHAYGDSTLASMSVGLNGTNINSSDFVLPITNNIQIELHSGTTILKQNMMLLPGSSLTVDQGAVLNLAYTDAVGEVVTTGGYVLQVFDGDNWTWGYHAGMPGAETLFEDATYEKTTGLLMCQPSKQFQAVPYTCTSRKTRTTADLTDVTVDINGTVITNGFLYSTVTWKDFDNEDYSIAGGGANIISSGKTGTVAMNNGAGQDMMTVMFDQTKAAYYYIPLASAQLKNGDGTLVDTTDAEAGTTYNYCAKHDQWYTGTCADCVAGSVEITWANLGFDTDYTQEFDVGSIPSYEHTTIPTKAADGCTTYTFAGWKDKDDKEYPTGTALPTATEDATYFAYFTSEEVHDWNDPTYSVSEDGTKHTANYTCKSNSEHTKSDAAVPHDYTSGTSAHTCICGAVETYTVTVSATENGTVKADKTKATVDTEVYLTVNPVEGYELYSLTYTDAEGDEIEITEDYGNYYFTMPASDVTVTAVFAKPYNVYVAGQQVFDINAADVLGDGKVSYDVATNTLTLNGATIQGVQNDDIQVHQGAGIAYFGDYESNADTLTIKLVGTNTVTALSSTSVSPVGIHVVEADVVITGTGTLNVSAFAPEYTGEYGRQVRCSAIELNNGGLTIESGVTVNATATTEGKDGVYNTAIVATDDITIKGTVNVKSLNADKTTEGLADYIVGIYAYSGTVTIDDAKVTVEVDDGGIVCGIGLESGVGIDIINGAEVTVSVGDAASGDTTGIAVKYDGSINIKKSTVIAGAGNAASGNSSGIAVQGEGAVAIENSTVTAKGGTVVDDSVSHGIGSMGSVTISGSTVTAQGETYGIGAEGNVSISGGTVKATATGTALGYGIGANGTVNIAADVTGEFTGGTMAVGATKGVTHEEGDYEITVKDELADEASKVSSIPAADWANYDYVKIETHTGVLTYENLGAEGHKAYYNCCQTPDDVDAKPHDYNYDAENHKCVCGAVETYTVTVYNEYGQADEITLSNTTATYGKDYVTTVTSSVGSDVDVWSFILKSDYDNGELWNGSAYDFNADTNTLTIPAKYITGDIMVEVVPYVTVKTHLNGGDVSEDWKYTYVPDDDVITVEWEVGNELYIFPAYDEDTDTMIDGANTVFVREGHTVTGYATSANSTEVAYEINKMYTFTEDTELYLIWQCQHAATEAVDNGDGTHDIVCANEDCKAVLKDNEGHDYDNGVCVCEAKQTYTITYDGNGYQFYNYSTGWQKTLTEQASHGDTVTVAQYRTAEYSLELKGNVFAGWNTKADGTGDAYKPGDQISATANLTLYAQWDEIAVGSATLSSGEYVDLNGNVTTTKPEGGYAYYENGKLTMNNYSFNGTGYLWNNGSWQATAAVCYNDETLTIELVGSNSLTDTTYDDSNAIYAWDLTITGTGSLTVTSSNESVLADNLTISGCTVTAGSSNNFGIYCYETLTIDNATVHVTEGGIEAEESITLKGVIVKTPAGGAISEDGTEIVDSEGEFANEVLIAVPRTYNVTFNGTNVTSNGAATFTEGSGDYTAILTAAEGYDLPETVTVKIGTTNTTINVVDGKITIPAANITGNVEITAVGVVKTYTITWTVDGEPYATATVNHGDTITVPETDPTKGEENEYRFKGWEGFTEGMTASGDQTFTANFAELYFVSYSLGVSGGYVGYFEEGETIDYTNLPAVGAYDTETVEKVVKGVAWVTLDGSEKPVVMPAEDITLQLQHNRTGWFIHSSVSGEIYGIGYVKNNVPIEKEGWYELPADHTDLDGDTAWYYIKKTTITTETTDPADEDGLTELTGYFRVSGITRVHYPTEAINGITFGPNAEDAANTEYNYTDATDARFVFDEDGKFQYDLTGFCNEGKNYAVNGQLLWHVGLVTDGTDYYYFVGANEMATGDVYVSRNTTDREVVIGGVYTFGADGKLIENNGIVDMTDGSKRYYEDAQLMLGNGLTKVGDNYIYVRSDGTLPVDTTYWVANVNGYDLAAGMYEFDANGYLIIPEADPVKNGIYFEKDAWYYYLNGMKAYNAGLISGTFTWIDADGTETEATAVIYVRSNGALATGKYWITNVTLEGYEKGFYDFDEMGKLSGRQNGIIDGVYYVNGEIQYNAGLIEHNGGLIYVRSNGKVVMNRTYWITNTNGLKPAGCYEFDADGYMIVGTQNGIVKENGKLYYYVGGIKQIGTGLVVYGDSYIYVKTSGELATGAYWVTNVGTTGKEQGLYEFGTDGIMIK